MTELSSKPPCDLNFLEIICSLAEAVFNSSCISSFSFLLSRSLAVSLANKDWKLPQKEPTP